MNELSIQLVTFFVCVYNYNQTKNFIYHPILSFFFLFMEQSTIHNKNSHEHTLFSLALSSTSNSHEQTHFLCFFLSILKTHTTLLIFFFFGLKNTGSNKITNTTLHEQHPLSRNQTHTKKIYRFAVKRTHTHTIC